MRGVEVASLYASLGADLSPFQRGMRQFNSALGTAQGGLNKFSGMLGRGLLVTAGAAATGIAALGGVIVSATGDAEDMQQAVADISADMGLMTDEAERVKDAITDLGLDPKLKVDAVEAADAIHMLGKNGLDLEEILGGAARATVLLSNSTGGDFATSADLATDVMAQFNIEAGDMMKAVNGITGVTRYSKFDINGYRLAIAQAGGVAASVGVDFDDFNATIAAISPLFASGSDAGTSFKTFLQRLVPDTKPAREAMAELNLLTEDGKSKFFDASGQMKSMSEIAGLLSDAFAGLSEEQKIQAASSIFGTDAMRAAFAIADSGAGTIEDLKAKIGNVDAEESAAKRMDTLAGSWEIFLGIVDALKIKIGDAFLPVAKRLADTLSDLATKHGDRIVRFFGQLAEQIEAVVNWAIDAAVEGDTMNKWLTKMSPNVRSVVLGMVDFANSVKEWTPTALAAIKTIGDFIDKLGGLKTIAIAVGGIMAGGFVLNVLSWIATIVSAIGTIASFVGGITGIGSALGAIVAFFNPVTLAIGALVAAAAGLYVAWQNNFLGIRDVTYSVLDAIRSALATFGPAAADMMLKPLQFGLQKFIEYHNFLIRTFNAGLAYVPGASALQIPEIPVPGFAAGGMFARGGMALVGERGPELVDLPGGSYIHNAADTGRMMATGQRIDLYVHAQSTMPTDRAAIREMARALQKELGLSGARVVLA